MANGSGNVSNIIEIGGLDTLSTGSFGISTQPSATIPDGSVGVYKTLIGSHNGSITAGNYYQLIDPSVGSTQYQVPSGKKFQIIKMVLINTDAAAGIEGTFGWSTASFTDGASSVTSPVNFAGPASNPRHMYCSGSPSVQTPTVFSSSFPSSLPALSYVYFLTMTSNATSNCSFYLIGKEV